MHVCTHTYTQDFKDRDIGRQVPRAVAETVLVRQSEKQHHDREKGMAEEVW